jgi:hypothetical protein
MNTDITAAQMKTISLAASFAPCLKQIVKLATVAEGAMAPNYADFISDVKQLCADFGPLCRAGSTEQLIQRFNRTLYLCIAVQQNAEQKAVN